MAGDMGAMPVPELTLVRFLWEESPDASIVESTVVMAPGRRLGEWLWRVRCGVASGSCCLGWL